MTIDELVENSQQWIFSNSRGVSGARMKNSSGMLKELYLNTCDELPKYWA